MLYDISFFAAHFVLLLFGVFFTAAFSGIQYTKKNFLLYIIFTFCCALFQLLVYGVSKEDMVWKIYPLLTHLPLILVLCFYFKKKVSTVVISLTTSYLLCQPSKFLGLVAYYTTEIPAMEYITRIIVLVFTGFLLIKFFAEYLIQLFENDIRILAILGTLPVCYYLYDYGFGIYKDSWDFAPFVAEELLPLLLVFIHIMFCIAYYREYELRQVAELKEGIIQTASEQQAKELDSIKISMHEIRILRHDMRHLLENVNFCLETNDVLKAQELISGYISHIDATVVTRYCKNDTLNYVASSFAAKCRQHRVSLELSIEVDEIPVDEILFCSILTNAFDNALNAQLALLEPERMIKLNITNFNGRILISVKNSFRHKPILVNGIPVTKRKGHGYGTQSIRYLTEKLGGNCQFSVQDNLFVVRLVI